MTEQTEKLHEEGIKKIAAKRKEKADQEYEIARRVMKLEATTQHEDLLITREAMATIEKELADLEGEFSPTAIASWDASDKEDNRLVHGGQIKTFTTYVYSEADAFIAALAGDIADTKPEKLFTLTDKAVRIAILNAMTKEQDEAATLIEINKKEIKRVSKKKGTRPAFVSMTTEDKFHFDKDLSEYLPGEEGGDDEQ